MKVLVVQGSDRHTVRLLEGLQKCPIELYHTNKLCNELNNRYDLVLIDPSFDYDIGRNLNANLIGFYDCEDSPLNFNPKTAYHTLKHRSKFYAKMNYYEGSDNRKDNIPNIGFPLSPFFDLIDTSKVEVSSLSHLTAIPFLVASPTFIGDLKVRAPEESLDGVTYLKHHSTGEVSYNQRYEWLLDLRKYTLPHVGGIVFHAEGNLCLSYQTSLFGDVSKFLVNPLSRYEYINLLMNHYKIGLCPTGHERMSWRVFDIMASGALLIWTDNKNQKCMYNPVEYITVSDCTSLSNSLLTNWKEFKQRHKASVKNREVFKQLTPTKIWKDFLEQID